MLSLPISKRSSAYPPARFPLPTNSSASDREVLRPVIILCISVLWRPLVDGTTRCYLRQGLDPRIRAQMAIYDDNVGLESFMQKAVKISQCLTACQLDKTISFSILTSCMSSSTRAYASGYQLSLTHWASSTSCHLYPATVNCTTTHPCHFVSVSALVDSGSSGNLISQALLRQLDLPHQRQAQALKIKTIQGKPLRRGHIKFRSPPITLQVGCLHQESISCLVLEGPTVDVILGHPWLSQHSPEVR